MKKIIFGTDWWSDCDDVVALRVITRFIKDKKAELLGIGINGCMEYSVASVRGFLRADKIEGIPIGIDRAATDCHGEALYQKRLADDYAPDITNSDAEDAVSMYRRLLAESDGGVDILEVGFLQIISGLLMSGADEYSPLSGVELVKEKVSKIWVMGGKWDVDGAKEHNFSVRSWARKAAHEFTSLCPVPVTFLGFEIGVNVISGRRLDKSDHLYRVMCDYGFPNGRASFDPMLTLLALIGDEAEAGYSTVTGWASVDIDTGANHFTEDPNGLHKYVKFKFDKEYYENALDSII